jgi:hypothetical protein
VERSRLVAEAFARGLQSQAPTQEQQHGANAEMCSVSDAAAAEPVAPAVVAHAVANANASANTNTVGDASTVANARPDTSSLHLCEQGADENLPGHSTPTPEMSDG